MNANLWLCRTKKKTNKMHLKQQIWTWTFQSEHWPSSCLLYSFTFSFSFHSQLNHPAEGVHPVCWNPMKQNVPHMEIRLLFCRVQYKILVNTKALFAPSLHVTIAKHYSFSAGVNHPPSPQSTSIIVPIIIGIFTAHCILTAWHIKKRQILFPLCMHCQ